ncbi:MAG: ABC transporter ATP-binding protein [Ktedonobacteraceae bacterium]
MLEIHNVSFNYSEQGEQDAPPALRDVTLHLHEGETIAIIGHNGSGKSTLAKLLAAILQPTSGSILVDGLGTSARGEDLWTIRQRVGVVFQNPDDQLVASTVLDEIAFGPENIGLPRFEIRERVDEAIALLGLEPYAQMSINELSVGQKQRVAVAGVLAMRPRYLILDEPTTMISGQTARHLLETVQRLARERGITVIHITHFMYEVATFDRVIVMDAGRVVMDDKPAAVFARADELQARGLAVPMVTHLGAQLHTMGWGKSQEVVLSAEHLRDMVKGIVTLPINIEQHHRAQEPKSVHSFAQPFAFELQDVAYTYLRGTPLALEALHNLSLTIAQGSITALVGATNAGKSTIVDLLACLIKPTTGTVWFDGENTAANAFKIERIRSQVGVVFQSPESQIFEETVGKDVSFGLRRKNTPLAESRRLVQESLEGVGLPYEDFRSRYTYALSGGQKRRVAIAGVLALQPQVIIFDEPMAGLDPRGRSELLKLIAGLKQRAELTIIYASSSLEDVIEIADTIHILDQGRLIVSGGPREILAYADQLQLLDITLPEVARIALTIQEALPGFRTDVLHLAELEDELGHVLLQEKNTETV